MINELEFFKLTINDNERQMKTPAITANTHSLKASLAFILAIMKKAIRVQNDVIKFNIKIVILLNPASLKIA